MGDVGTVSGFGSACHRQNLRDSSFAMADRIRGNLHGVEVDRVEHHPWDPRAALAPLVDILLTSILDITIDKYTSPQQLLHKLNECKTNPNFKQNIQTKLVTNHLLDQIQSSIWNAAGSLQKIVQTKNDTKSPQPHRTTTNKPNRSSLRHFAKPLPRHPPAADLMSVQGTPKPYTEITPSNSPATHRNSNAMCASPCNSSRSASSPPLKIPRSPPLSARSPLSKTSSHGALLVPSQNFASHLQPSPKPDTKEHVALVIEPISGSNAPPLREEVGYGSTGTTWPRLGKTSPLKKHPNSGLHDAKATQPPIVNEISLLDLSDDDRQHLLSLYDIGALKPNDPAPRQMRYLQRVRSAALAE